MLKDAVEHYDEPEKKKFMDNIQTKVSSSTSPLTFTDLYPDISLDYFRLYCVLLDVSKMYILFTLYGWLHRYVSVPDT